MYSGQAPDWENPQDDYPLIVTQPNGKTVPVVQAYAFTKYLGYIHLEFDDEGALQEIDGTPILLNAMIPRDSDVLALLEKYRPGILELENEIVGSTKVLLDGNCRRRECNLGNFIADSLVDWRAVNYNGSAFWTDSSIGIMQSGGIRASINHKSNQGHITKEDAATVLPFESKIVIVEVTGKALLEALEHSVHRYTDLEQRGEFLQYSGIQVVYNMNNPPLQRVVDAKVLCSQCTVPELESLNLTMTYRIVMLDFLANGGDGYHMFKIVENFDILEIDVFLQYLKKKSPVTQAVEWRITIKDEIDPSDDIVGSTRVLLDGNCRNSECNLGNFITDAMVDWHAWKYEGNDSWTDASIALIQGSRIKTSIDPKTNNGMISKEAASKVFQPAFFNLSLITLKGNELLDLLEYSISKFTEQDASRVEFLQMSGMQVVYDLNKPSGQRVAAIKILCAHCTIPELEPLNVERDYKILMQSVLASGVDGFDAIIKNRIVQDLNESDVNVFINYLKKKSPVHPAVEWRITFVKENSETTTNPETTSNGISSTSQIAVTSSEIPSTTTLSASNRQISLILFAISLLFNFVKSH